MRKILSLCFILILVVSLLSGLTLEVGAAGLEKTISGSIAKITYNQTGSGEEIRIITSNTSILRQYVLPPNNDCKNYRMGFEIKDASIRDNGAMDINRGSVVQIRYALKKDPLSVSIVIETTKKPEYTLSAASDGKSLIVKLSGTPAATAPTATPAATVAPKPSPTPTPKPATTPSPSIMPNPAPVSQSGNGGAVSSQNNGINSASGPVSWSLQNDTCVVKLDGINLQQPTATGRIPTVEMREKEKLLQITIPGRDTRFVSGILSGNSIVHGFLINYNDKLDATLVRITWKQAVSYTQEFSNGSSLIKIKLAGGSGSVATNPTPTPKPSATPAPTPVPVSDPNRGETSRTPNGSIEFGSDRIKINTPVTTGYKVYRMGTPSRIIVEVPCILPPTDKLMAGSLYQRATVLQMSDNMAKIILDAPEMPQWSVTETAGRLEIAFSGGGTANIVGGNNDGLVALKITGSDIVSKYRQFGSGIIAENNTAQGVYAFMIPSGITTLGQGTVNMGDNLLNSVSTYSTPESSFLLLSKKHVNTEFKIVEGSNANELYVMVGSSGTSSGSSGNQNTSGKKLIVLDPGHGGSDPGGDVGSYYEKAYNLDISLRVEAILQRNGYNVLLTRRTDVFVELADRCRIANDSGAALFVSIHNNKMPNPSYKGSMALYYPTSYKGKEYARIFLSNLTQMGLGGMGTVGLSARGDLFVLKNTKMPAVLLEVACMTNSEDLNLLNTESFRQQAAENIANSIMQIGKTL